MLLSNGKAKGPNESPIEELLVDARIHAEWDPLRTVVVHRPGLEMFLGLLEPYGSLYERAFNRHEARREHEGLEHALNREFGVNVLRLKETILDEADRNSKVRDRLVQLSNSAISFVGDRNAVEMAKKELKRSTSLLDSAHFFSIILLHPEIEIAPEKLPRAVHLHITEKEPLSNLYFLRDQQAVTDKGVFLSRMAKPQRRREPLITRFLWEVLGVEITHEAQDPATIEGGDFMPMKDFALVGIGDRTNASGIDQLLKFGLGFQEVAVVHQPNHPLIPGNQADPMINMHLDTYFNVASSGVVVGSELLLKRARVEVYRRESEGVYKKARLETNLHEFMKRKGFDVIDISTLEQMSYASNFLCIRDGTILTAVVERVVKNVLANLTSKAEDNPARYGKLLEQAQKDYRRLKSSGGFFPHKKAIYDHDIDAYPIPIKNLTGGYGGTHCMTCTLKRG